MVVFNPVSRLFLYCGLLAQQEPRAKTLPEPYRSIALMALLGIALLGMLMIVATLLGGHWVRRWGDRVRRPAVPPDVLVPRQARLAKPNRTDEPGSDGDTHGTDETTIS